MSDIWGDQNQTENIKVALLGNSYVGKTCIFDRYIYNIFEDNKQTLAPSYSQKYLEIENRKVILQIWDTAGIEKFRFFM